MCHAASASAVSNYTPSFSLKTKRQEAKAAAEAAAAAAADACAVCGLLYGDDAVKDDFWIACDKCNRWYHGACVELTQVKFSPCLLFMHILRLGVPSPLYRVFGPSLHIEILDCLQHLLMSSSCLCLAAFACKQQDCIQRRNVHTQACICVAGSPIHLPSLL